MHGLTHHLETEIGSTKYTKVTKFQQVVAASSLTQWVKSQYESNSLELLDFVPFVYFVDQFP
jgi:hypothetical protein